MARDIETWASYVETKQVSIITSQPTLGPRMSLKEASYPVDGRGRPDLRYYADSLEHYIRMYEQHLGALQGKKGTGYEIELAFSRRVYATWGLIGKGAAAVPYASDLIERSEPEAREDGAAILAELGKDEVVIDKLIDAYRPRSGQTSRLLETLQWEGLAVAYTMADFNRYFVKKHIHLLTAEELKELLRSVPVEIRLAGASMEDIKRYVDRLAAQRPALPRKPQRKK